MISAMGFVAALLCAACVVSNVLNIPFAPIAWKFAFVAMVFCFGVGVANWDKK